MLNARKFATGFVFCVSRKLKFSKLTCSRELKMEVCLRDADALLGCGGAQANRKLATAHRDKVNTHMTTTKKTIVLTCSMACKMGILSVCEMKNQVLPNPRLQTAPERFFFIFFLEKLSIKFE